MKNILILLTSICLALPCSGKGGSSYDVIVAGAGTGGFGVAIQAARGGCNVLLLEESDYLGGQMAAAGVGTMDEGFRRIRDNGIYREFCSLVSAHYASIGLANNLCYWSTTSFSIEPCVAQKIMYDMIAATNKEGSGHIELMLLSKVTKVLKDGNKVVGATVRTGISKKTEKDFGCSILVDATEYGDVIPLTGARYMIAKHTSDSIDRQSNVQENTWTAIVKEYPEGIPDRLRVKEKPRNYNMYLWRYKWIREYADDPYNVYANPTSWNTVVHYRGMPDSGRKGVPDHIVKTELNISQNDLPFKVNDCINPDARFSREVELRTKTLGLLYYLQNELGLNWSVDPGEGFDTPYNCANIDRIISLDPSFASARDVLVHFPVHPYVRESFRIIGQHILISSEINREKGPARFDDAVSVNDYPEDLHGSNKPEDLDLDLDPDAINRTHISDWNARCGEFQVPMRSFIPESLDGFLAAEKNLSQSRIANGATRLQPSTMNNGQAVGNLAAVAVRYGCQPRRVPAILVQWEQVRAKSPLWFVPIIDVPVASETWNYAQIALVKGYFSLSDGSRFYPERLVGKEELSAFIDRFSLEGCVDRNASITRRALAKLIIDREIQNAAESIR